MNVPEAWRTQKARYRLEASIGSDGKLQFPPRLPKAGEVVRQAMAVRQQPVVNDSNDFDTGRTNGKDRFTSNTKKFIGRPNHHFDDLNQTNGHEVTTNGGWQEPTPLSLPILLEILGEAMRQTTDQEAAD